MVQAKRIYILMIKSKQVAFLFPLWCFLKEIENISLKCQSSPALSLIPRQEKVILFIDTLKMLRSGGHYISKGTLYYAMHYLSQKR